MTTKYQGRAYTRIAEATPALVDHPGIEAALISKLTAFSWEAGIAKDFIRGEDVLRLLDYHSYFSGLNKPIPESTTGILETLGTEGLIDLDAGGRWNILNLGALLFAHKLSDFPKVERKTLRVVRYEGDSKTDKASEYDIECGYVKGYDQLVDHLHAILPKSEEIGRAIRAVTPIYPQEALRELIANALIHQDMTLSGSGPMVDIFSRRMEISNPGAPLVEPERFLDTPPRSRNEKLAALLRRFGICEERGSGVRKSVAACEVFQLPAPEFVRYDAGVRVTLFAPRKFGEMDADARLRACYQHAVLQYVADKKMTNSSLRQRFGINKNNAAQVSKVITKAIEEDLIRQSKDWSPRLGYYLPYWAVSS